MREAVVFTTGYQANLAIIGALCGPQDAVLLDAESHASLCDGARLSGATVTWIQHNSPEHLARKLARLPAAGRNRLVVAEGLYSIRGDVARLADIAAICREHEAYLLVDEAHSFGVYGTRGLGCSEAQGVLESVDFIVGAFSKALGGTGGFCVSNHPELAMLRFTARAYMFTASGTPASLAAARTALEIVTRDGSLRDRLWQHLHAFRTGLQSLGYSTSDTDSPIVPIFVGAEALTLSLWEALVEAGVYVNAVVPPACPADACLLRASCSAVHSDREIAEALDIFGVVGRRLGIVPAPAALAGVTMSR
jgi:8-amino-7-oxononanoate synthase